MINVLDHLGYKDWYTSITSIIIMHRFPLCFWFPLKTNYYEKIMLGLQELVSKPNIPV